MPKTCVILAPLLIGLGCIATPTANTSPVVADTVHVEQAVADAMANVDARVGTVEKTVGQINTRYDTDLWLNRGIMLGLLVVVLYVLRAAKQYAMRFGYDEGRKRRLANNRGLTREQSDRLAVEHRRGVGKQGEKLQSNSAAIK